MTTEAIYQKYATEIAAVTGDGSWIDWGVMRLALRLAIADAHDAGLQTCSQMADDLAAIAANQDKALQNALDQVDQLRRERKSQPDQPHYEFLMAQIDRLNDWLAEHEPAHYCEPGDTATAVIAALDEARQETADLLAQLAAMDADNANLTQRCGDLRTELVEVMMSRNHWLDQLAEVAEQRDAMQREIDRLTHQNTIAVDTFNSLLEPAAIHTNGDAPARPAPSDWHAFLDDEANDWRISLDAGRRRFGDIPKLARLHIIQAILRGTQIDTGNTAAMPTMADYDAVRPDWAPGSTGLTRTFGCGWRDILDLTEVAE